MGRNRKTYSESFKKQVAIEAMDGKKTVAEIAASNNIAPGMVSAWKKAFINGEFSKDLKKAQKENEELKKRSAADPVPQRTDMSRYEQASTDDMKGTRYDRAAQIFGSK